MPATTSEAKPKLFHLAIDGILGLRFASMTKDGTIVGGTHVFDRVAGQGKNINEFFRIYMRSRNTQPNIKAATFVDGGYRVLGPPIVLTSMERYVRQTEADKLQEADNA